MAQTRTDAPKNRPPPTLTAPVMLERERWLIRLRWMAAAGMVVLPAAARWIFGLGLAIEAIFGLATLVASYNLLILIWLRRYERRDAGDGSYRDLRIVTNLQISLDLLVLALLLHFSGGVTNPLGIFMVFHMAIASILLPRRDSYFQAAWAGALYVSMAVLEAVFPGLHRPLLGYMAPAGAPRLEAFARPLFVAGECGVLVITLFLIVYFTSDIADRLRGVYSQLADANEELANLEKIKSRFLHVAGHQIRTPLAALHSLLEAMQVSGTSLSEDQRRMIARAQSRAEGMLELINEMLTLSAVKENLQAANARTVVDAGAVLTSVVELHAQAATAGGVELACETDGPAPVLVWGDALQDVFDNLVSNAVKYTPSGGRIHATCQVKGRRVVVTIADTGIGIPPAAQADLFTEFFRAPNAKGVAGGTGLGLSIVKEILDRLGGRITLCSDVDSGTTIQVDLPKA